MKELTIQELIDKLQTAKDKSQKVKILCGDIWCGKVVNVLQGENHVVVKSYIKNL